MGKLKRSYSDRLGVAMTSLRFLYDGKRIPDDATPGLLEMERWGKKELVFVVCGFQLGSFHSGDYIEVYRELGRELADVRVPLPADMKVLLILNEKTDLLLITQQAHGVVVAADNARIEPAGLFVDKELQEVIPAT